MEIRSPDFRAGDRIPEKYTCDGEDVNCMLVFDEIPENARTLALIMDDPDSPKGNFVHWLLFNIPVSVTVEENTAPGTEGVNGFGRIGYGGPCPHKGTHRYRFMLYALDAALELGKGADRKTLEDAMEGHIIEETMLTGTYSRRVPFAEPARV